RKKVTADFAGGSISSDGGLVLLRAADRRPGRAETRAGCIREGRAPARAVHTLPAMSRFRMFAIACGYEDADDCDNRIVTELIVFQASHADRPNQPCRYTCFCYYRYYVW
ncbi:MAG: transposase, partial [Alphaproteobacteria bacterium]|nr:transposase [Alphaproteobacteria bacterium]